MSCAESASRWVSRQQSAAGRPCGDWGCGGWSLVVQWVVLWLQWHLPVHRLCSSARRGMGTAAPAWQ